VRRHFPSVHTPEQAQAEAGRIREALLQRGWGCWALEIPGVLPFAGFVGLMVQAFEAPFTPCVEIGWRLPQAAWGGGYATEAARAAAQFAFDHLGLDEIVSMTTPSNTPSQRVMQRLGMRRDPGDDFDHPRVPEGHALRRHVLYRLDRASFRRTLSTAST
jgi:RimJ/RimL family protein N-acetyltransferase